MNHVQSKNISRWPILEYQSQAVVLLESEEKIEIRQFVSFLQVFPCLVWLGEFLKGGTLL